MPQATVLKISEIFDTNPKRQGQPLTTVVYSSTEGGAGVVKIPKAKKDVTTEDIRRVINEDLATDAKHVGKVIDL